MSEANIVSACLASREAYETLTMHCRLGDFSPLASHWLKEIRSYYERDKDARSVARSTIRQIGMERADARHHDTLLAFFDALPQVSAPNVVAEILLHKKQQLGLRLSALLADPASDHESVRAMLEEYSELADRAERGSVKLNVLDTSEIHSAYDPEKIVPLFPQALSTQCLGGGAQPGHHILIFGRPEAGKSLLTIHLACGAAYKGKRVLYFGNEENVRTHYTRAACNLAAQNIQDFQGNADKIIELANKRGLDNITFVELTPGTLAEIEMGIVEYKPDLVIVDQLAGIEVGESNPVRAIDRAARGFRTLLLKHGVVGISVSQAGDRTERHGQIPPAFLSMGDVYGSRTGLPAQVDLMLGIGYDDDMYQRDVRGISLPKNKLGGSHTGFKVRIDKQQSRVRSLT